MEFIDKNNKAGHRSKYPAFYCLIKKDYTVAESPLILLQL